MYIQEISAQSSWAAQHLLRSQLTQYSQCPQPVQYPQHTQAIRHSQHPQPTQSMRRGRRRRHPQAMPHLQRPLCRADQEAGRAAQRGFSLVEVSIVMAIVLLLAIIAIPTVSAYVIESKVPKVGEELARFILHTRVNAASGSSAPYEGIGNANLANMVRGSSIFSISGDAAAPIVKHGLGADGEVSVAEAEGGAAFTITLSNVSHAACPSIASVMQRVSDEISLVPQGGASTVIKDATKMYSALETESRCSQGDGNTFVFTAG